MPRQGRSPRRWRRSCGGWRVGWEWRAWQSRAGTASPERSPPPSACDFGPPRLPPPHQPPADPVASAPVARSGRAAAATGLVPSLRQPPASSGGDFSSSSFRRRFPPPAGPRRNISRRQVRWRLLQQLLPVPLAATGRPPPPRQPRAAPVATSAAAPYGTAGRHRLAPPPRRPPAAPVLHQRQALGVDEVMRRRSQSTSRCKHNPRSAAALQGSAS